MTLLWGGAAIFELLNIRHRSHIIPHLELVKTGSGDPLLSRPAAGGRALFVKGSGLKFGKGQLREYLRTILQHVQKVKAHARTSSDLAIRHEIAKVDSGTHSWYRLLSRPDAKAAGRADYPVSQYPWYFYSLLEGALKLPSIESVSFFAESDVGLVRSACNELILRRGGTSSDQFGKMARPVRLCIHPDYVCWDEDDNMYKLPGWPDWADLASWSENLPPASDLLVLTETEDGLHFKMVEMGSRWAISSVVMINYIESHPRCRLHPTFSWYWHSGNVFVGVRNTESLALRHGVRQLANSNAMESVAPSERDDGDKAKRP